MVGQRILQARRARGFSQRELAARAGDISAQAISLYENGEDMPSSPVLIRLASALDVGTDYFFRTVSVDLGQPAYRKHCSLPQREMKAVECRVVDAVERYLEVEALLGLDVDDHFELPPSFNEPVRGLEHAERSADELRTFWRIGADALNNLTELLEDHGTKVVFVKADNRFDGCAYHKGSVPVIAVNREMPGDRMRLDLAHELGHLVLSFPEGTPGKEQESTAFRFAAAFLVPADTARRELGMKRSNLSVFELLSLKHKYGISMQAWVRRARDLDIISEAAYGKLCREFAIRGWRIREPGEPLRREESDRQLRLVVRAYSSGLISESRGAKLLGMLVHQFSDLLDERMVDMSSAEWLDAVDMVA